VSLSNTDNSGIFFATGDSVRVTLDDGYFWNGIIIDFLDKGFYRVWGPYGEEYTDVHKDQIRKI
jgi:hypothetical protein